jgi:hypothetical protein
VDPLLGWFVTQALGPQLVGKACDLASKAPADWRKGLARDATEAAAVPFLWRGVYRWLEADSTWPDLLEPSREGGARLVTDLARFLKPRIVVRRQRYTPERRRLAAEKIVGEVGARFLESLDPSLVTAVAHYRQMPPTQRSGVQISPTRLQLRRQALGGNAGGAATFAACAGGSAFWQ